MKVLKSVTGLLTGYSLVLAESILACLALFIIYPQLPAQSFSLMVILCSALIVITMLGFSGQGIIAIGISQAGSRMMFKNAVELVNSIKDPVTGKRLYNAESAVCTQSYLRGQNPLATTAQSYNIPILKNNADQTTTRVLNKLLAIQDIFVTFQIGGFITIGASTDGAAVPYTYGNVVAFSTSGAAAALWSVYNGYITLLNNNQQVVPAFDMLRFYKAPLGQALAVLYYASSPTPQDQKDLFEDVFTPIEPGWVINGAGNMVMTVVCPGAPAAIQANSCVDIIQRGILLQNVTPVN